MNSVITLTSDYGSGSPYTAAIIGAALSHIPQARVVEISHQLPAFDVVQGAFLLRSVYKNFPVGSIHLMCIDTAIALHKQLLIVEVDGHYFMGADNGMFSLLFDQLPKKVYKILENLYTPTELFPEKNVFIPVVAKFLEKGDLRGLAEPSEIKNIKMESQPVTTENGIRGIVMLVDGYGNAITNIHRSLFEQIGSNRAFKVYYRNKQYIDQISQQFHAAGVGDDILLYNENGFLMVAIYKGRGAQLLGIKPSTRVVVEFENEEGN